MKSQNIQKALSLIILLVIALFITVSARSVEATTFNSELALEENDGIAEIQELQDMIFSLRMQVVELKDRSTKLELSNADLKNDLNNYKEIMDCLQNDSEKAFRWISYFDGRIKVLEGK